MGGGYHTDIRLPGMSASIPTAANFVTAGYLEALGVRILAGRGITEGDIRSGAAVAVVSEDFEKETGRSPVGLLVGLDDETVEIVGVAARARYSRLTQEHKVVYVADSLKQDKLSAVLRTSVPPMQVLDGVRRAIAGMDPDLPIVNTRSMEEQIAATLRRERLLAWLCGAFGVVALVLCMVGLYGVMAYATSRRTHEIGVRMALGASPGDVLKHIVGEGMALALGGCLLGSPLAWWAARRYVDYKRLGMEPLDPGVLVWASAALAGTALIAVLQPALRAAWADPMKALRDG
jgi:predicted lysophospholipase L1 biosynthesis ABC-type transport system permease subunit